LRNFFDTDIKINVFEQGKEKDFSKIKTIDKINGPIVFFNDWKNLSAKKSPKFLASFFLNKYQFFV